LDFPDLGRLACVSRDMRQLVQQSPSTSSFKHHQRGARLYATLDLATILRHSRMPPAFVEEMMRSWAFYSYIAHRGVENVARDLLHIVAHAYQVGVTYRTPAVGLSCYARTDPRFHQAELTKRDGALRRFAEAPHGNNRAYLFSIVERLAILYA